MTDTRYVGIKEETEYGKLEATTEYDFQVASAGLDVPDDPNIVLPILGRFDERHIAGYYSPSGPLELPVDIATITYFLKWALGGYKFTEGTLPAPNKHEFYATQEFELPSFNTRVGKDTFEHIFTGCVADTLSISVENELAMLNVGVTAQRDTKDVLRTGAALNKPDPDLYPMAFYNAKCEVDSVDLSHIIKSWNWEFGNGVNADDGQGLGSRFPYNMKPTKGECGLTINVLDEDTDFLEEFWGNANGPADSEWQNEAGVDTHVPFPVETFFESGEFGDMKIVMPKCYYTKVPTAISGGDPRRPDLAIKCEADTVLLADGITEVKTPVYILLENFENTLVLTP